MKIILSDLEKISHIVLTHAEQSGISRINVVLDYYWHIAADDSRKKKMPAVLPVGSLTDDLNCLGKVLTKENIATTIDFERLGNVVKIIGYRIQQPIVSEIPDERPHVTIDIPKIKRLHKIILGKAQQAHLEEIELDTDSYLCISPEDAYNLTKSPDPITKSLANDWNSLKEILINQSEPTPTNFEQLGTVLVFIGEAIHSSKGITAWLTINN
jgi:hypothetical protein